MYKFNYWSIPISQEALDIRYFLFDCVQANYKPHNPLFLGPSYKQAFLVDDVYNREVKSVRQMPSYVARLVGNNNESSKPVASLLQDDSKVLIKSFYSSSSSKSFSSVVTVLSLFLLNFIIFF